jgi:hypothetical protein
MQLIDRYLYAIGKNLPQQRRDDILAELRANILAMAEDKEQELGRPLTIEEEEAILKQHGAPMLVAARYLPQQYLIGPMVFPYYWHVMKLAFPWVALIYVLAHIARFIFEPVTATRIVEIVLGFVPVLFYTAGWITLVFAAMEFATSRYMKNTKALYSWSPRKLPQVELEHPGERRSHPIVDFIGSLFGLAFLIVARQHPVLVMGPGVVFLNVFHPAPVWYMVYEIALVYASIQLAIKLIAIFSPMVRSWRVPIDLATKAGAIAILGFLLAHGREYLVLGSGADAAKYQPAIHDVNYAVHLGLKVLIVILSAQWLWEFAKVIFPRWHGLAKPSHFIA